MSDDEQLVTIHLSEALGADLRSRSTGSSRDLRRVLAKFKLHPRPLFPQSRQPGAQRIWHLKCAQADAAACVEALLRIPGVEGAYVKPQEGMPGPP